MPLWVPDPHKEPLTSDTPQDAAPSPVQYFLLITWMKS